MSRALQPMAEKEIQGWDLSNHDVSCPLCFVSHFVLILMSELLWFMYLFCVIEITRLLFD